MTDAPTHRKGTTSRGYITSAPYSENAKGYAFVETSRGPVVYVPRHIVAEHDLTGGDIGSPVVITYIAQPDGKFLCVELKLADDADELAYAEEDEDLVDAIDELEARIEEMDGTIAQLRLLIANRACSPAL